MEGHRKGGSAGCPYRRSCKFTQTSSWLSSMPLTSQSAASSFAFSHLFSHAPAFPHFFPVSDLHSLLLIASKVTINRGHYCKRKGDSLQPQTEAMQAEALHIRFNVIAQEVPFLHFWSGCPQFRKGTKL